MRYSKKCAKNRCVCFNEIIYEVNYDKNQAVNER